MSNSRARYNFCYVTHNWNIFVEHAQNKSEDCCLQPEAASTDPNISHAECRQLSGKKGNLTCKLDRSGSHSAQMSGHILCYCDSAGTDGRGDSSFMSPIYCVVEKG